MVLFIQKYDVLPEKLEAYNEWVPEAIKRCLSVPGIVELRAYRPATGAHQVVSTWEFADMASWGAWADNEVIVKAREELQAFTCNRYNELWGPSPVLSEPVRTK